MSRARRNDEPSTPASAGDDAPTTEGLLRALREQGAVVEVVGGALKIHGAIPAELRRAVVENREALVRIVGGTADSVPSHPHWVTARLVENERRLAEIVPDRDRVYWQLQQVNPLHAIRVMEMERALAIVAQNAARGEASEAELSVAITACEGTWQFAVTWLESLAGRRCWNCGADGGILFDMTGVLLCPACADRAGAPSDAPGQGANGESNG